MHFSCLLGTVLKWCDVVTEAVPHTMQTWYGCWYQVVLVSATLPVEVLEMTNKFMNQPLKVMVKRDELTLEVS